MINLHFPASARRVLCCLGLLAGALAPAVNAQAQAPTITAVSAARQVVTLGQSLTLTVTSSGATSYQWRHGGRPIAGATGASYTIASATTADAGWYQAIATNSSGSTTSTTVFVLVRASVTQVAGWGNASVISRVPTGLTDVLQVAMGRWMAIALRANGSATSWYNYSAPALSDAVAVAAGNEHGLALKSDGTVVQWGSTYGGQAAPPAGLGNVVAIAAGSYHSLALKADGTVVAWGSATLGATAVPAGLTDVVAIAAGDGYSLAEKSDGTVVGWGNNGSGQSGIPPAFSGATQISAGSVFALAAKADGSVTGWGSNASGELSFPAGLTNVVGIAAGETHALALRSDGTVAAWGTNGNGEANVPAGLNSVMAVAATSGGSLILRNASADVLPTITTAPAAQSVFAGQDVRLSVAAAGGTAFFTYQWQKDGIAIPGATGASLVLPRATTADAGSYKVVVTNWLGSATSTAAAVTVDASPAISLNVTGRQVLTPGQSLNLTSTCALGGTVSYQWRRNGQPIAGATSASYAVSNATWRDAGVYQVVATNSGGPVVSRGVYVVVTPTLQLRTWGDNSSGQTTVPAGLSNVIAVSAGRSHSLALKADGTVVAWGANDKGQCNVPAGLNNVFAIAASESSSLALKADGTVVSWGLINYIPAGLANVIAIASSNSGSEDIALRDDGTVVAWNAQGVRSDVPPTLDHVVAIAAGPNYDLALKNDGTVVGWGSGAGASVPNGLAGVTSLAAGGYYSLYSTSLVAKSDGSVAAWGYNASSVPAGISNAVSVAVSDYAVFALKSDGRVVQGGSFSAIPADLDQVVALSVGSSHALALRDATADSVPVVTTAPASQIITSGQTITLTVTATGGSLSYQWRKNGAPIAGATGASYTVSNAQSTSAGTYDVVITNYLGTTTSSAATLSFPPAVLANLSTRTTVPIGGVTGYFRIDGSAPKQVLVRGVGPSLSSFGVSGVLANPQIELMDASATVIASNDDWAGSAALTSAFSAVGAFPLGSTNQDAALLTTLAPGFYAVRLTGVGNTTGVGLLEVYDAEPTSASKLTYAGIRAPAANPTVVGFSLSGTGPSSFTARAIGPALASYGQSDFAPDPTLTLYTSSGATIASNDNWDASQAAVVSAGVQASFGAIPLPAGSRDAAVATTLAGSNTAHVNAGTGQLIFELFDGSVAAGPRAPYVLIAPVAQNVASGQSVTLSVVAGGTDTLSYQWRKGGTPISGANSAALTIPTVAAADAGAYSVTISNPSGSVTTPAATVSVIPPVAPTILSSPGSQGVVVGQNISLSVAATGFPSPTYQWRKAGAAIAGATSATYTLYNVQLADAGDYDVVVTNAGGSVTSAVASLTVSPPVPPTIVGQPTSVLLNSGNACRFYVSTTGTYPMTYQWRRNGIPIQGATYSNYGFIATPAADPGVYDVVVTNAAGSVVSQPATVSFGQLPVTVNPGNQFIRLGEGFTLSTAASSGLQYQWYKNGVAIAGATSANYRVVSATTSDLGSYSVTVTDGVSAPSTRGPATVALRGSAALGKLFVAVGAGGTVLTSADGAAWTARDSGVTADLRGVAALGGSVVAVGTNGTILTSSNGASWTAHPSNWTGALNGVAAGPDRLVAVGDSGRVQVSPDGLAWYVADSRTSANLNSIAYGNGQYVMVGATGTLFTSPDGFNWTNRDSLNRNVISYVTFSGSQFWALTSAGQLITSADGTTWTLSSAPVPSWLRGVSSNGQTFVAVGDASRVQTSNDGQTWSPVSVTTLANLLAVTWSGPELPAGVAPANLLSDANFRITTQPVSYSAVRGQPAAFSVATSGGGQQYQWYRNGTAISGATGQTLTFAAVSPTDVGDYSVMITAAAGVLTSQTVKLGLIGSGSIGSQYIAVGEDGVVLSSVDGASFTVRGSAPGRIYRAVAASAFRAVAVGRNGAAAVSDDGVAWQVRNLPNTATMRGVAAGPTQFVAVGNGGAILVSTDQGDSWQSVNSPTTSSLWSVAWNGSRFLAVGESGAVLSSPDGLVWTVATSPTTARLYGVAANGATFVAVTDDGHLFTSADAGATWAPGAVSGALWIRSVAADPTGRRVAVGDNGTIASTTNGTDWTNETSPTAQRLYGIVWTGAAPAVAAVGDATVNGPALRIVVQPVAASAAAGATASFSVAASGVAPITYQWQHDGSSLAGATSPTLLLANVQNSDSGLYSVLVSGPTGTLASVAVPLTVSVPQPGAAPAITASPENRAATVGGSVSFSVTATGAFPISYQWRFNGQPIPGALGSTLTLSNLQLANAGSYTVTVTNAFGSVTSGAAALAVSNATGSPVVTKQPAAQTAPIGSDVAFTVSATGVAPLSYQWRKDGVAIAGATGSTLTLHSITSGDAGSYSVSVVNAYGTTYSENAALTVIPAGMAATHVVVGTGYVPGGTVTISCTLSYVGSADAIGWDVVLPAGWSYAGGTGAQGDVKPLVGDTQLLSWAWSTQPASPVTFSYTLNVPADASGTYTLSALAIVRQGGVPIQLLGQPDPLLLNPLASVHSADTTGDGRIDLVELTRVIELFNARTGTTRTGRYAVATTSTEDGFTADTTTSPTATVVLARYHSADSDHDARISLVELTRVIELYNYRQGTTRTGQYHVQSGTEDGFAPGPTP